jgi:hypothetical protein
VRGRAVKAIYSFFLTQSLHHNCPKMAIANLSEIGTHNTLRIKHDFFEKTHNKPREFRKFVHKLISKSSFDDPLLPTIIFETNEPLGNWDVLSDPLPFQHDFHILFKYNPYLMRIS